MDVGECFARVQRLMSHRWAVLAAWQIGSVILCAAATVVTYISNEYGASLPFLLVTITYSLLLIGSVWFAPSSALSWFGFAVVSVLTIAGDYAGILAYSKTSMASALLLVTSVVFWVAPLAYFMFRRKVSIGQGLAILLAICGSVIIFIDEGTEGNSWVGDVLALGSALCYAVLTVAQEYLIHSDSFRLYLFRFSVVAAPIAGVLAGAVEWKSIRDLQWGWRSTLLVLAYSLALAAYDCWVPFVMQFSDATTMNLSLLTSNFFSLGISVWLFGQKPRWLYLVGFFCVPLAIVIFTLTAPKNQTPEISTTLVESIIEREVVYSRFTAPANSESPPENLARGE
jgi:drug/metabolite transporter (DMT)-like permease